MNNASSVVLIIASVIFAVVVFFLAVWLIRFILGINVIIKTLDDSKEELKKLNYTLSKLVMQNEKQNELHYK